MKEHLSDQLDVASELEMKASYATIKYISSKANKLEIEAKGYCLFCGEDFDESLTKRWCDANCRQDFEREKLRNR
jgi:hypothetical protein